MHTCTCACHDHSTTTPYPLACRECPPGYLCMCVHVCALSTTTPYPTPPRLSRMSTRCARLTPALSAATAHDSSHGAPSTNQLSRSTGTSAGDAGRGLPGREGPRARMRLKANWRMRSSASWSLRRVNGWGGVSESRVSKRCENKG